VRRLGLAHPLAEIRQLARAMFDLALQDAPFASLDHAGFLLS
jgi:hypothetical protein